MEMAGDNPTNLRMLPDDASKRQPFGTGKQSPIPCLNASGERRVMYCHDGRRVAGLSKPRLEPAELLALELATVLPLGACCPAQQVSAHLDRRCS